MISKLEIPVRWKLRLLRHFWRDEYFNDLLSRLETNADIDPTEVAVDKRRYLNLLKKEYSIPDKNIVGHQHVAPERKTDPGPNFDWSKINAGHLDR